VSSKINTLLSLLCSRGGLVSDQGNEIRSQWLGAKSTQTSPFLLLEDRGDGQS
jgi:hypothetical protein